MFVADSDRHFPLIHTTMQQSRVASLHDALSDECDIRTQMLRS